MDRMDVPSEEEVREARAILSRLDKAGAKMPAPAKQHAPKRADNLTGRGVRLASSYVVGTMTASLYTTLLTHLARLGRLELQAQLFAVFKQNATASSARALLKKIGVTRTELDAAIRADESFAEYCDEKTRRLQARAARGDASAISILNSSKSCDKRGKWRGDIDEAVGILRGRRAPNLRGVHKNVDIIKRARLLFNTGVRGTDEVCFLYDQRYFRLFEKARTLSNE